MPTPATTDCTPATKATTLSASRDSHVLIIGAGPAGLGVAAELGRLGVAAVVLERTEVGASWRRRYDGLRLNTAAWLSHLPGWRLPRAAGRWPTREAYVEYLERYVAEKGVLVRTGVEVTRVDRLADGFRLTTSQEALEAPNVVVATGYDRLPNMPRWAGREQFAGELLHVGDYRNPAPFRGRDVLVVGLGNSGCEVAVQLLRGGAARVRVSVRTPANLMPRELLGVPMSALGQIDRPAFLVDRVGALIQRLAWGEMERSGLARAPYGLASELRTHGRGPVGDSGLVAALKRGEIEIVAAVERFEGPTVVLADARRIRPEVVIAATGYRYELEPLVGHLEVLGPTGRPTVKPGCGDPTNPGLYFNGYHLPLGGQLPAMRRSSIALAQTIGRRGARSRPPSAPQARSTRTPHASAPTETIERPRVWTPTRRAWRIVARG